MGMRLCLHRGCADGNSTRRALEPKYGPQCPSPANVRVFSGGEAVNQQGRQLRDAISSPAGRRSVRLEWHERLSMCPR